MDALKHVSKTKDKTVDPLVVAAFYKFVQLNDLASLQDQIESCCRENNVFGIVLLAQEGINSTIAGPREGVVKVLERIRQGLPFFRSSVEGVVRHETAFSEVTCPAEEGNCDSGCPRS